MAVTLSIGDSWRAFNPRVVFSGGKEHAPQVQAVASWPTFSRIWLPSQMKKNMSVDKIFFDLPDYDVTQIPQHIQIIESQLREVFSRMTLDTPAMFIIYTEAQEKHVPEVYGSLCSVNVFFMSNVQYANIVSQKVSHDQNMEQILINRKKRFAEQIRAVGFPKLVQPYSIFEARVAPYFKFAESKGELFHKFLAHLFRRLDWKLKSQVKIKWDKTARLAYLKHLYETHDKQKISAFLVVARRSLPHPLNILPVDQLLDILVRSPILQEGDGLTYEEAFRWFYEEETPREIGKGFNLLPPKLLIATLEKNLLMFTELVGFEKQALMGIAETTKHISRHVLFMAQSLEIIEKKSHNPIKVGNLGFPKRWETNRVFLDITIPEAIEGTNTILLMRDYIRTSY